MESDLPGARARTGYDMTPETPIRKLHNMGEGVSAPGWSRTDEAARRAIEVAHKVAKVLG